MSFYQQEVNEALSSETEKYLKIELSENQLVLQKQRSNFEYAYWLLLIIGLPAFLLMYSPSGIGLIIAIGLSLCFAYLIYDSSSATNKMIIDLAHRELSVISINRVFKTDKVISFDEVLNGTLAQKSFGRGQPEGKRLFIHTTYGKSITALDFRNAATAEKVESLLNRIIKDWRTTYHNQV